MRSSSFSSLSTRFGETGGGGREEVEKEEVEGKEEGKKMERRV